MNEIITLTIYIGYSILENQKWNAIKKKRSAIMQIESKRLKSIKKYKKIKNKHQMVIERISRDCRKFGMIFPSPFSHNGKLNIH